jgi:XTP/dITP diphosphohydrolase
MKIVLSTRNRTKAAQVQAIFHATPVEILSLEELPEIKGQSEEDGETLLENAHKKAEYVFVRIPSSRLGLWVVADDTGLFIDALDGAPGVHAARWAGPSATTQGVIAHTLKMMDGIRDRAATFETAIALIDPFGKRTLFSGKVRGTLLTSPRGPHREGMPYSSIFVPDGETRVWAEMTVEEENVRSHRGQAFDAMRLFIAQKHWV